MRIEKIEASRLNPAAYNPRRDLKPRDKDYEKLKRSIEEFGFVEPVVWNERTGFVVGGHQRLKVLLDLGQTLIDCVVVDLEPEREKACFEPYPGRLGRRKVSGIAGGSGCLRL